MVMLEIYLCTENLYVVNGVPVVEQERGQREALDYMYKYLEKPWLKFYDEDVPPEVEIPEKPLYWILEEAARLQPNKTALFFLGTRITYKELYSQAKTFAGFLKSIGVGKSDIVGLLLPNTPQFVIAYYGSLLAGATVSPMNVLYTPSEIRFQLKDNSAKVLVALDLFKEKVEAALPDTVEKVVWTGIQDYLPSIKAFLFSLKFKPPKVKEDERNTTFKKALKAEPIKEPEEVEPGEDLAALMYTGGTTGLPKGAMLTHYNLLSNVIQIDAWFERGAKGRDVYVGALPWFHIYGMNAVLNAGIFRAATILTYPRWTLDTVLRDIQKHKATVFHGVPTMYVAIINHPKIGKFNLRSLEYCISGAAPLPVAVAKKFEELTGAKLREGYGLTETSPVTHVNPMKGNARPGSIGIPVPSTIAAIADPEKPVFLKPGEIGEIVVSGPQVMKGYYNRPEENSKAFFEAGGLRWFRTGDMGYMDEDGFFYVVDRKKDLIKYKGYSVYPREIEEVLYKHECIKEAAVIGVPHEEFNEVPKAFIVLKPECEGKIDEEQLLNYLKENLAPYKVPKSIEFRKDLPKSAVGKVLRRLLREEELEKLKKHK